ncbi:HAD family phosphatase [Anaerococcus sp. mt242]|uniref:HAD family hydrolase n=1 Tax=unclassified Anaerococcus TaxID=2614126 RepID=UPI001933202F|nr:HAD-IB family hydrolase [Anaerococcus sp. mt242]MBM0045725.1 HAD-IB family hydrolase [Anaerococcus sp. mt242]
MNKAAFFDIDGTLFRNSLLIEHFLLLTADGIIDEKSWTEEIGPLFDKYQNRLGAYEDYLDKASLVYQQTLAGIDKEIINKYSDIVIEKNKNKVYRITKRAVKFHKENGYKIFFISGSPMFLVEHFGEIYGADESISTQYEFDENNTFTGKVTPMWDNRSKLGAVMELSKKYNLDLDASYAYGDTNGDLTMFQMVGNPHAINPSFELINKLYTDSELREKTVIDIERKDVNYSFKLSDMQASFKKF